MILDRNVSGSDLKNLSPSNFRLQFEPFQLPKSWQAHSNLYINIPNVPNSLLLVTVSVTLTDVWCCSPIVRVRVVLRSSSIDPFDDLRRTYRNVGQWFRKQSFVGLLSPGQWNYTQLHHWWCFGVTDLGRGNKFLGLAFPQEMKNSPSLPCYLPNTPLF